MPRFEAQYAGGWFFEIERDGVTVRTCTGNDHSQRTRETVHPTEDQARYAYGRAMRTQRSSHWKNVGPTKILTPGPAPRPAGSMLAAEEYFAAADDRFLDELLRVAAAGKLGAFAKRWFDDARPWARAQLLAYIDDGCDRPFHKPLVKHLMQLAETAGDDAAMGHFMVAFDALGHRLLAKRARWKSDQELVGDPNLLERLRDREADAAAQPHFTRSTRRYLARRAYRYFRFLGHRDAPRYGRAIRAALRLYRDEHLDAPARLLDSWGLLSALHRWSKIIVIGSRGMYLRDGKSLGQLAPAPHFPSAWESCFDAIVELLFAAEAQIVRTWAIGWLREHYASDLSTLPYALVKRALLSPHPELQALGGEALKKAPGLDALPLAEWLELLAIENLDVVPIVVELVEKHVAPSRLTLAQCIELACARIAPVARLGLAWARGKHVRGAADLQLIARLAKAGVAGVRAEGTAWAAQTIAADPSATPEALRDLCDAPFADAREQALATVAATPRLATPLLWFALAESPYDDVRAVVIANAAKWRAEATPETLRHVWTTALANVHRGAVEKRRVPRAIAERIAAHPDEAAELLPLLAFALRSVRAPERIGALAALARAAGGDAPLRELAHRLIPELTITEQVA